MGVNKVELVKILETISKDGDLEPDEAMKLTEELLQLFRQKPIIREVPTPCPYPHYPQPYIFPDPYPYPGTPIWTDPITYGDKTGDPMPQDRGITFCCHTKIIPASQGMSDPTLSLGYAPDIIVDYQ